MNHLSAFSFLPSSHWVADDVLWAGLALVLAGICGEVCWQRWRIPRITGYGLVGVLVGASGLFGTALLNGPDGSVVQLLPDARVLVDIALGVQLFQLGGHVSLRWLRNNPSLIVVSLLEAILTLILVTGTALLFGVSSMTAWVLGGIAIAGGPAVVMQLRTELRSQGQVSERMLALSGLNSVYAVLFVKLGSAWPHQVFYGDIAASLLQPAYLIGGSLLTGLALAGLFHLLGRYVVGYSMTGRPIRAGRWGRDEPLSSSEAVRFAPAGGVPQDGGLRDKDRGAAVVMLFGPVLLTIGICELFKLSSILALLVAGMLFHNHSERPRSWARESGSASWVLTVILFVLTTATFRVSDLAAGGVVAVAVLLVRLVAKVGTTALMAKASGIGLGKGAVLGVTLAPMSSLAFVLMSDEYQLYPAFDPHLKSIVLCAVVLSQLILPYCVYRALRAVQETPASLDLPRRDAGRQNRKDGSASTA